MTTCLRHAASKVSCFKELDSEKKKMCNASALFLPVNPNPFPLPPQTVLGYSSHRTSIESRGLSFSMAPLKRRSGLKYQETHLLLSLTRELENALAFFCHCSHKTGKGRKQGQLVQKYYSWFCHFPAVQSRLL